MQFGDDPSDEVGVVVGEGGMTFPSGKALRRAVGSVRTNKRVRVTDQVVVHIESGLFPSIVIFRFAQVLPQPPPLASPCPPSSASQRSRYPWGANKVTRRRGKGG